MKYIKSIHDLIDLLTKKGKTGYIPRVDIDIAVYTASKDLFREEYRLYEQNQEISDSLTPFKTDPTTLTPNGSGQATKPADYLHCTSIRAGNYDVDIIDEAFIGNKLIDEICPPALDFPVCVFYKTYIQFYPITGLTGVKITYLKNPIAPVYAYTLVNGREVYDHANSVDIEWNVSDQDRVTKGALAILGIVLSDQEITGFALEEKKNND